MSAPSRDPQSVSVETLVELAAGLITPGRRAVLGIAGPPGAGKSTLAAALVSGLGARATLVPMDGFHLAQQELARLGTADRKGAPETFDAAGYAALLRRLRTETGQVVYAPAFNRGLEEPIAGAIPVGPEIELVITEGNYLLLADHGFERVGPLLDQTWYLDLDPAVRRARLVRRRIGDGHHPDDSRAWVTTVDEANAQLVDATRQLADRRFMLGTDRPA